MNTARRWGPSDGPTLDERVKAYGCPDLVDLASNPTSAHLEYLDLLPDRSPSPLLPDAVAEFQGRAVMYLVDQEAADQARRQQKQRSDNDEGVEQPPLS